MNVVRQWKRDASENLMSLEVACDNIAGNCEWAKNQKRETPKIRIMARLKNGETVETKHARFFLSKGS